MHVAFPADRDSVAKLRGDRADRLRHVAATLAWRRGRAEGAQRPRTKHRACPGAEILAAEVVAGDGADIRVHVARFDGAASPVLVDVAEELIARQVEHMAYDVREVAIGESDLMGDAALAAEAELQPRALHADLALAQGRQPIRCVRACVLLVADAHE